MITLHFHLQPQHKYEFFSYVFLIRQIMLSPFDYLLPLNKLNCEEYSVK